MRHQRIWRSLGRFGLASGLALAPGCMRDDPARDAGTIDMSAAKARAEGREPGKPADRGLTGEREPAAAKKKS